MLAGNLNYSVRKGSKNDNEGEEEHDAGRGMRLLSYRVSIDRRKTIP